MSPKFYANNPWSLEKDDTDMLERLNQSSEKALLALIAFQLMRLNASVAQIGKRVFEPTFMESRHEDLPREVWDDPKLTSSGFELIMNELKEINSRLEGRYGR